MKTKHVKNIIIGTLVWATLISCGGGRPNISKGGDRPDLTGLFTSIAGGAIKMALKAHGIRNQMLLAPVKVAFYAIFSKDRADYRNQLLVVRDSLKNYLSSTPNGVDEATFEVHDLNRSNKEIWEIQNSVLNMNQVVEKYREDLLDDRSNHKLAVEYYTVQYECYLAMTEMSREFLENIGAVYRPGLVEVENRLAKMLEESKSTIPELSEENQADMRLLQKQQEIGLAAAQNALASLGEQKIWAEAREDFFREKVEVTKMALETAKAVRDLAVLVGNIQSGLDALAGEPLPLVVFESDIEDFLIELNSDTASP